ncbi:MAG: S1 RNA-binding domain-containing protein, partial [Nitrospira sp.]|nr:S1 RNA-binding domain-containing protein [Nitrospira sp.]
HQDGLVQVSALATKFVKDQHEVVKPGQIVTVKVRDVDLTRQRISLTMRLDDAPGRASSPRPSSGEASAGPAREAQGKRPSAPPRGQERQPPPGGTMAMALALARAKQKSS